MESEYLFDILKNEEINIEISKNDVREIVGKDENYYEISYDNNRYCLNFVRLEKLQIAEVSKICEFDDKLSAIKVFILYLLSKKYMFKAQSIISKNIRRFVGNCEINENEIKKLLIDNGINSNHISFFDFMNEESILLEKKDDGWYTYYLDSNLEKVFGSKVPCTRREGYMRTVREGVMLKYFNDFVIKYNLDSEFSTKEKKIFLKYI